MKTRQHGILALAVGATLALGGSTANAGVVAGDGASLTSGSSVSSQSTAAHKALPLRGEATTKSNRQKHSVGNATRPDDRSGARGV
jgi:hypothetical protein